ncbi:MAG TPA: glucoamylase family protein [Clostridia bacterium]|nr:glucoamylase family protein [Clostridia bacterium]
MKLLKLESRLCFNFLWEQVNSDPKSPGYGLILDSTNQPKIASIASVGFGLSAIPIGIERGWITSAEGYERVLGTLNTLINNVDDHKGFYAHFVDIKTGERWNNCEYSTIDTAILINGAICVGEYFGGKIKELSEVIYKMVDWDFIVDKENNRFYMHYWPEIYPEGHSGLGGQWDYFAEQLMMYILGAGSPTSKLGPELYYRMGKLTGEYKGEIYIRGWYNSLFIHQFSHAWFDSAGYVDRDGVNWFNNSVKATLANRQYCIDNPEGFRTYNSKAWGLTACAGPGGYSGRYGTLPSGIVDEVNNNDGTVPICGPAGSVPFTPQESMDALLHAYECYPSLWGKYGFYDSYNLDQAEPWFSKEYIGINKGITLLMIENHLSGLVWDLYMKNQFIKDGLKTLMFSEVKKDMGWPDRPMDSPLKTA